ncbi:forkhead-associated domain-containing protein 1-like isoform X2 [Neopsephotus bourkii]|uniref:forkhead-associated domain-containing protein 1-like isoform X2 n=1 Tax=Neopsephotus bourkii TaxID=309878 RepID=UPI002AA54D9B|nr:forkhead-associated domain-containing protein 1-like isoform X2 [Neopsephotus bourkii]
MMRAFLRSSEGCFQLKAHTTTIGRHEGSDIVLQSAGVAQHHAALEFTASDNSFCLQDLNSPHGTFINGCQVQNAAVRVSPGDVLCFGKGGAAFELVVDGAAQVSDLPKKHRTGWTGQVQAVAEPRASTPASPAQLPLLQWQHPPGSPGRWAPGATSPVSHPLLWKRPRSAWARSVATTVSLDAFSRTSAVRPVSSSILSDGVSRMGRAPSLGAQDTEEKGEKEEMGPLSGLETEPKQKDAAIRDLQEEIAAMAKTLSQVAARNEVELTQKLLAFERELEAKAELIRALREQLSNLEKGSSQVFSHSLRERDLEIGRLQKESEKLKRDHSLTTGLVTSLQREIAGKEQKIQQLQQEAEKVKKESRAKDNHLAMLSAQCSRIREEMKQELGQREVMACQNRIKELEHDLERLQGEMREYCIEQESIRSQLAEKAKAEEELREAGARQALQLQEMGRRERLLRSDLARAKQQLESFKTQVMRVCSPAAAGKAITEQQVIEKVRQVCDESQRSNEREKCLQEEINSRLAKEKEVSASAEVFKKSLQELQAQLSRSCSSASLRGELGKLEAVCLDPSISTIGVAAVEMARVLLSWLEAAEQLLAGVGMDLHKGLLAALGTLVEASQETAQRNQTLQAQLEKAQESQAALLQEHTKQLETKHEQVLQLKIKHILLEKDKESKELLESAVAQEKSKYRQSLEEEQKKLQDLESHLRSMAEAIERRSKEQEAAECKLQEAVQKLEESTVREMVLQQRVLAQDEQLRTLQEENELQKQKLQGEIEESKEQSKQHALTIVALEERLLEAKEQQKTLEEEHTALVEQMKGFEGDTCQAPLGAGLEACPAAESQGCVRRFREELLRAQNALLSKEAVITGLTKELAETRARLTDLRGELSEEHKVELEQNLTRLKHQEQELNLLREKLSRMSSLVEKKDEALEAAAEELRQALSHCQELKDAQEMAKKPEAAPGAPAQAGEASKQEPVLDLADVGRRCRGLRHEETIQRQREGLAELRERVKVLEKRQSSAATMKGSEPPVVLTKCLAEEIVQRTGHEKEPTAVSGPNLKASKVPGCVPNGGSQGAASWEMGDTMDFGEQMYLDAISALGRLMKVEELSGMQSLRHLPPEERGKAGLQRRKDLELLCDKIRNLRSRLERNEEKLKEYEGRVEQLRLNQASLQRCQEEVSRLEEEASREAEEKALLQEALERTQLQLNQGKRQRAAKLHRGSPREQPGAKKPFCSGKLKAKECTAEAVKMGSAQERHHVGLWYDAGKDGFIDLMELKLMMEKLGAPQTHLGLKNMIKEVDEDLDSKLSFREFLLIFRKAAAGELQEDSGLHALARLSEIDVSTEGVKGAKNFFEAKVQAIHDASRFEEEIKAEQEEKKKQAEELKQRKAAFKELQSTFKQ